MNDLASERRSRVNISAEQWSRNYDLCHQPNLGRKENRYIYQMDPGVILAFIFIVIYLILMVVFIDRHNSLHGKIAAAQKKLRRKLLSEEKFKKIKTKNIKKAEETKNFGFILMSVCSVLHVAISLVIWNFGTHLTFIPLVSIPIFFLLLWIGFWLKGAGTVNKNMRLPESPMH